ncbi:MAG: hypothetical protein U9Q08_00035 [Candidatus Omnitrophota bacterium]|nr:hypothetical protein [Candidatus Omnitrophota bacterium]
MAIHRKAKVKIHRRRRRKAKRERLKAKELKVEDFFSGGFYIGKRKE